ncbi:MAG: IPT/TIG domain-containing protein [Syntrophobacteraceae bacterium]
MSKDFRFQLMFGIALFASAFFLFSPPDSTAGLKQLDHRVIDAEYSKSLDRIITVSAEPKNQLHIYNPETGEDTSVDLEKAPTCVSVSPDGLRAAVGHSAMVSLIDLTGSAVIQTTPVSSDVFDVVLAGNGYVYTIQRDFYVYAFLKSVNLQTAEETSASGNFSDSSRLELHPDGKEIYATGHFQISKYNIESGAAAYLYTVSQDIYRKFWISQEGKRIFTIDGYIYNTSASQSMDIRYNGTINNIYAIAGLTHHTDANKVLLIPFTSEFAYANQEVWVHDDKYLQLQGKVKLPRFPAGGTSFGHGRHVFFNSAGNKYYVILQSNPKEGLLMDYGVVDYQLSRSIVRYSVQTGAGTGGRISPSGKVLVKKYGSQLFAILPDPGFEVADVQVDGVSVGKKSAYIFEGVRESHAISATFQRSSNENPLVILSHRVIDAEYSRHLDKIISVSEIPLKQLHIYDPITRDELTVNLPLAPTCVSVGPDGQRAAVGHDGWISYIDLLVPKLIKTFPISIPVVDVVLAGNGYVYAFSDLDSVLKSISLESGRESDSEDRNYGQMGKLHPGGESIFVATTFDIMKYNIKGGKAVFASRANTTCGENLWISEDGSRIFSAHREIFGSGDDMAHMGTLTGETAIKSLDHSMAQNRIIATPEYSSNEGAVFMWDDRSFDFVGQVKIPRFIMSNGWPTTTRGRFVFFNKVGDSYFALVQPDFNSDFPIDWAVVRYATEEPHIISAAAYDSGGTISPSGKISVPYASSSEFVFTPNPGFEISDVKVDGVSVGKPSSYTFDFVVKSHIIRVSFAPRKIDHFGMEVGNTQRLTVSSGGSTGQITSTVTKKDATSFSQPTFVVEKTSGSESRKEWYQVTSTRVGIRQIQSSEGTLTYSKPLIIAKSSLVEGDSWITEAKAYAGGGSGTVKLEVSVGKKAITRTPAGFFTYWPLTYKYTITGPGGTVVQNWVEWFTPYIGTVKSRDSSGTTTELTSFSVAGGAINTAPPIISKITPASSTPGSIITIAGYNFGTLSNAKSIRIGGKKVTEISSWQSRKIICTVPAGVSSGPVTVSTGFWSTYGDFSVN